MKRFLFWFDCFNRDRNQLDRERDVKTSEQKLKVFTVKPGSASRRSLWLQLGTKSALQAPIAEDNGSEFLWKLQLRLPGTVQPLPWKQPDLCTHYVMKNSPESIKYNPPCHCGIFWHPEETGKFKWVKILSKLFFVSIFATFTNCY